MCVLCMCAYTVYIYMYVRVDIDMYAWVYSDAIHFISFKPESAKLGRIAEFRSEQVIVYG